jgi:nucleotidyltransferase substrate binding protein (TIGR01987 family)
MNRNEDIRWKQRLANFTKALAQLEKFVSQAPDLNEMEQQGLIQSFEYNFELSWNVIKDFYEDQGAVGLQGSRDAYRMAFNRGLIRDGKAWMDMIESRKKTTHTYDERTAKEVVQLILATYYPMFKELYLALLTHQNQEDD